MRSAFLNLKYDIPTEGINHGATAIEVRADDCTTGTEFHRGQFASFNQNNPEGKVLMENMIFLAAESLWPPARVVAAAIGIAMVSLALILFGVGLYTLPKDYRLRFGRRGFRQ